MFRTSDRNDTVLAEASESINRAIQQVRSLSHLLHPPLLDEVGLRCALEPFLEGFSKRSGIETSVDVKPANFRASSLNSRPRFSASCRKA